MNTGERKRYWVGVDLAKRSFDVSVVEYGTQIRAYRTLPVCHIDHSSGSAEGVDEMIDWIMDQIDGGEVVGICVESTGPYSKRFAHQVARTALPGVSIVNPKRVKDFRGSQGIKHQTDSVDAAVLALFGRVYEPPALPLQSEAENTLKELMRMRTSLVEERAAWKNRAQNALTQAGYDCALEVIHTLSDKINALQRQVDQIIKNDKALRTQVKMLCDIRGIGKVTAHTITAELGLLANYSRREVVGAVGLYPVFKESGTSVKTKPRLAKGGKAPVRRVLYLCAISLYHNPGPYEVFINRLKREGKEKMCIIGALMRKLLTVARTVIVQGGYYDEHRIGEMKVG